MPINRQLHPSDEAALERFLLTRLDSSMFLLGNMRSAGLVDNGERYSGTYVAAFDGDQIVGVVAHYWNNVLMCQAPTALEQLWQQAVALSGRPIGGIIGLAEQTDVICQELAITPEQHQISGREGLFTLALDELILPTSIEAGTVVARRMTVEDTDQLAAWRAAYQLETLGSDDTPEMHAEAHAVMERLLQEQRTWVLEAEGQRVAMSAFNAALPEAVQVGGVYTPPELRGRGYGRAVVAASLRDASTEGVERAILFTDDENIGAQKAYRALGFQWITDWGLVLLKEPIIL